MFLPFIPHILARGRAISPLADQFLFSRRAALAWGGLLAWSGCQSLFQQDEHAAEVDVAGQLLKPLPSLRDGIRLDVFRVDRHIGDPRIGESMWKSVSQGGSLEPAAVRTLHSHGFRFGTVPANPPVSVQALILDPSSSESERTLHESFPFPAGEQAILNIVDFPEGMEISIPGPDGTRPLTLYQAKGVFRVRADKIEEGWARLEVIPEIHHGEMINRPVAGEREWIMRHSQAVEPLYMLKFHVELNRGEMAVVGLQESSELPLGRWFFRSRMERGLERVMMIRLADVFTVQAEA